MTTNQHLQDELMTIYRLESLRHYFKIMVENGRTGLLKEVEKSKRERSQKPTEGSGDE